MKSDKLINEVSRISKLRFASFLISVPFIALAAINPAEYITGATCEMSSDSRLTVTGGSGEIIKQLPAEITELCVTNGASLKIGIDNPFAAAQDVLAIYLYGDAAQTAGGNKFATLDLNGHDINVSKITNPWVSNDANVPHPGPGRVINTASSPSTVSLKLSKEQEFYGAFEEAPGKVTLNVIDGGTYNYLVFPSLAMDTQSTPPSSVSFSGGAQMYIADNPVELMFVFEPSDDHPELNGPISLAEIMPTFKGVPVKVFKIWASSSSQWEELKDSDKLIDGRVDTGWRCGNDSNKRVVMTFDANVPVDGYRIASWTETIARPKGWKVYKRSADKMRWWLVDDQSGAASRFWPTCGAVNSFSSNILFSAATRCGAFIGKESNVELNNTSRNTLAQLSSTKTVEVGSLSGKATGTISIKNGTTFSAADLTGFLGKFSAVDGQGKILLSSAVKSEQPLNIPVAQNLSIANVGTSPVSVLLDDSRTGHLFGTMKDGEKGTLGLVKRGTGERVIETEGASYTGPTAIREGTLTVARRMSFTARYIRFTPLEVRFLDSGANLYNYVWSMNEFILVDGNGKDVAWPSGSEVMAENGGQTLNQLIDGSDATRILVTASSDSGYPAVTIDAKENITFSAYRWCSCMQTYVDAVDRLPLRWKLEVKSDGSETWRTVDIAAYAWSSADQKVYDQGFKAQSGVFRGPFSVGGGSIAESKSSYTAPLAAELFASGGDRDTCRPLSAQYFRLKVFETQRPNRASYSYGWQMQEFSLWKNGKRVKWPENPDVAHVGSSLTGTPQNLVDNVFSGDNSTRFFPQIAPSRVTVAAGKALDFDAYSFTIFTDDYAVDRAPKSWTLEISQDGENWTTVDSVGSWTMPQSLINHTSSNRELGPFAVASKHPYLHSSAANSIGDTSPVTIDSGATLKIAANYEKFGPLSGAGDLNLPYGATAEINAIADAVFAGSVTGDNGTLAVGGVAVQTFSSAALSGVKTLELNGGTVAGSATFGGGDLALVFNGGALGAALSGIGTLSVRGEVVFVAPTDNNLKKYVVLSAESIPEEAKSKLAAGTVVGGDWSVKSVTDRQVVLRNNRQWGFHIIVR